MARFQIAEVVAAARVLERRGEVPFTRMALATELGVESQDADTSITNAVAVRKLECVNYKGPIPRYRLAA